MKTVFFPLILLLFSLQHATMANAAADYDIAAGLLPENYHGQWATPDCANPENIIIIKDHLILDALPHTNFVYRITKTEKTDNVLLAHFGNMNIYLEKRDDDRMDIEKIFLDEEHDTDHPYQNAASHKKNYRACETIAADWPATDKQALAAFSGIAALEQQCEGAYIEDSPACQQQMFGFVDQDMNGRLDHAELARLYRLAAYYGGSIACEFPHTFPGTTESDSAKFATQIIETMDRNDDNMLTPEEIRQGWDIALLEAPMAEKFMQITNDLSVLIYSIPHYPYIER